MKKKILALMLAAVLGILTLSGCATASGTTESAATTENEKLLEYFTERDLSGEYDTSGATQVTLNKTSITVDGDGAEADGQTLTISKEGTYIVEGSLNDGQIVVTADDTSKVQIVLNGVSITNDDSAAILITSADKVFLTLAEGTENTLADSGDTYQQSTDDYTVDGVIYSRDDITINGSGSLDIDANYKHAIVGKDDVKLAGATVTIDAAGKGIAGNDSVRIASGTYTVTSTDDAIHTSNGEEDGKGYVYIADGTFALTSEDDGIHAETDLIIDGGTIDVAKSYEGLEGKTITINGGDIDVKASDDGLNAASGGTEETGTAGSNTEAQQDFHGDRGGGGGMMNDTDEDCVLKVTGGTLTVDADGDGLDSNGTIEITGGKVYVNGPTNNGNAALDYGISATVDAGTLVAAGTSGMAESLSEDSKQYSILYNFSSTVSAGTEITLTDADGNEVMSYTVTKDMNSIVLSSADIQEGTYTIQAGDQSEEITVSSIVTTAGTASSGMGGGTHGGGMGSGQPPSGQPGSVSGSNQ